MLTNTEGKLEMNDRQRVAFKFPCARRPETTHQRFWSLMPVKGRLLSTILTVDTFNSRPMWHVSVAVLPTRRLSAVTKRIVIATAKLMLAGVGQQRIERGPDGSGHPLSAQPNR
jgi:hypothetical protein